MESYSFKSVAFGGFDKQDVVRYLEQSSEKAAAAQRELEAENEMLHRQAADQMEELDRLRVQVEELTEQRDRLREKLETEAACCGSCVFHREGRLPSHSSFQGSSLLFSSHGL